MSRGRPRHQASRRRTYSRRQREVKQRQARGPSDEQRPAHERLAAVEIEDGSELDAPGAWALHARLPAT